MAIASHRRRRVMAVGPHPRRINTGIESQPDPLSWKRGTRGGGPGALLVCVVACLAQDLSHLSDVMVSFVTTRHRYNIIALLWFSAFLSVIITNTLQIQYFQRLIHNSRVIVMSIHSPVVVRRKANIFTSTF